MGKEQTEERKSLIRADDLGENGLTQIPLS